MWQPRRGVNSFFINYAEESIHIEKQTASLYLAFGGMGLFFIGRLVGGVIMNYIQPRLVLLACAILTFVATLIVVVCSGTFISHCVLRPVSGREHHVSDDILAGIEGCGYKDQACFFVAYHDDSGWSGCPSNYGGILRIQLAVWRLPFLYRWYVRVIEGMHFRIALALLWQKSSFSENHPCPSLPLKRAPPSPLPSLSS